MNVSMTRKILKEKGWALFLDRDGVINKRIPENYVKHPDEFEFIPGVLEAFTILAGIFNPVVVVTNQQGIGRGMMTSEQLDLIHKKMFHEIQIAGGRLDAVYFSADLKNMRSFTRKPAVGMGLKARQEFPSISFKSSIMVGDTYSDILFGHRLGMITVLIGEDKNVAFQCAGILDYTFPDLIAFAEYLRNSL